jgi:tRNA dimethylallyltransferase
MTRGPSVIVVVGPTASGKSDFAVELARSYTLNKEPFIDGEIVSADSRQVYKGLDIGTGKITEEEMRGVPHYMLSTYSLDDQISVARYAHDALPHIEDIIARGKTPIICGGTGQYIDALIYTATVPRVKPDQDLRQKLETKTTEQLFDELQKKDLQRSQTIDKHNRVRLIRALEIIDSLGAVPPMEEKKFRHPTTIYLLNPSRATLNERITKRLEKRLSFGMIEEVKRVLEQGYKEDTLKRFGLEYVALGKYITKSASYEQMKEEIITASMRYAKRQQTWNKKYEPVAKKVDIR